MRDLLDSQAPLDAEEVRNSDGQEKQDCEVNAGKRLVRRLRQEHRQLKMVVTGDDLYSREPFVLLLREFRYGFVLVAKPTSHTELFEWVEELDRMGECAKGQWEEGPLSKRCYFISKLAHVNLGAAFGSNCVCSLTDWNSRAGTR